MFFCIVVQDTMDLEIAAAKTEQEIQDELDRESNASQSSVKAVARIIKQGTTSVSNVIRGAASGRPRVSSRNGHTNASTSLYSSTMGSSLLNNSQFGDAPASVVGDDGWRTHTTTGEGTGRSSFNI